MQRYSGDFPVSAAWIISFRLEMSNPSAEEAIQVFPNHTDDRTRYFILLHVKKEWTPEDRMNVLRKIGIAIGTQMPSFCAKSK